MASALDRYVTVRDYIGAQILATPGYDNVTIAYGDVIGKIDVPSCYVKLGEWDGTIIDAPFWSEFSLTVGFKVLYQAEDDFLPTLTPLIEAINSEGQTTCGVEMIWVSKLDWGAENKEYSMATLTVQVKCSHD